jgi:hypothetical protein
MSAATVARRAVGTVLDMSVTTESTVYQQLLYVLAQFARIFENIYQYAFSDGTLNPRLTR